MSRFVKIICTVMAALFCFAAAGCAVNKDNGDVGGVISSDDLEFLTDTTPEALTQGQSVTFGAYNGVSLEWTVTDVDSDGIATLLCNNVIDAVQFNDVRDITHVRDNETEDLYDELYVLNWEICSLRTWLNGTFLTTAFSETEQAKIYGGKLTTLNNPLTDRGACVTEDKVFLLSADEARDLFKTYPDYAKATATAAAKTAGVRVGAASDTSSYWLRSSGESMWHAACVNTDGTVNYSGMSVENGRIGLRPCIRLRSTVPGGEQITELSSAVLGNLVEFGTYEQDNDTSTTDEKIVWRVIDRTVEDDGTTTLWLISEKVLDAQKFSTSTTTAQKWANSDLRKWLNGDFMNTAFSTDEKAMILDTQNSTHDNAKYVVDSGEDTSDKVFILSMEEAELYLVEKGHGWEKAEATLYSQNRDGIGLSEYDHGVTVDPDYGTADWWLRNAGENDINAMYMYYYGAVCEEGTLVRNTFVGVRPCIRVSVTSAGTSQSVN